MKLTILTPEKEVFSGDITSVKVPGTSGQFEILSGHAPIVSSLGKGQVRVLDTNGERSTYLITQGFVEVYQNEVSLLVRGLHQELKLE